MKKHNETQTGSSLEVRVQQACRVGLCMKFPFSLEKNKVEELNSPVQYVAEHTWTVECNISDMREVIKPAAHKTERLVVDLILQGCDSKKLNYKTKIQNQSHGDRRRQSNTFHMFSQISFTCNPLCCLFCLFIFMVSLEQEGVNIHLQAHTHRKPRPLRQHPLASLF